MIHKCADAAEGADVAVRLCPYIIKMRGRRNMNRRLVDGYAGMLRVISGLIAQQFMNFASRHIIAFFELGAKVF